MRALIEGSPWWLLVIFWFAVFGGISLGSRFAVRRIASDERRAELAEYSGKLLSAVGATFAFLIGFATTMTWSAVNAGQEAVDLQASSAQQLAWSTNAISNKAGADEVILNLRRYLTIEVTQDKPYLASGNAGSLPSARAYDVLQDSVHNVAYHQGTTVPEASAMTSAAATLTAAQGKMAAVSQRSLPTLIIGLLFVAGSLLAVGMGTSSVKVDRPYLMYGWALVSAIALTVVLTLDFPFSGAISVNLAPLEQVANSLTVSK